MIMIPFFIKINDERIYMIYMIVKPLLLKFFKKEKKAMIFILLKTIAINFCSTLILIVSGGFWTPSRMNWF